MAFSNKIKAFVAHSFFEDDEPLIGKFLKYFNSLNEILEWTHAEEPQPKSISDKVKELMEDKDLLIGIFSKRYSVGAFKKKWLPSLWLVQESGYAIGKGMRFIFVIENTINKEEMSGLQGDYELIPFERRNPEKSFSKINHMLLKIFTEKSGKVELASKEEDPKKSEKETKSPEEEKSEGSLLYDLLMAIKNKDTKEEGRIYKELIAVTPPEQMDRRESFILSIKSRSGDKESFEKLKAKADKEDSYYPNLSLGKHYKKDLKNSKDAIFYFKKAFEYTQDFDQKIKALEEWIECLVNIKESERAYGVVTTFLNSSKYNDNEMSEIYKLLSKIANLDKEDRLYLSFLEKALEFNPHDKSARFDLAYRCNEIEQEASAVHHYKILSSMHPSGTVYNNLGVSYTISGLPILAVSSYCNAEEKYNDTLSMANLARKYINAGFLVKAKDILTKAKLIQDYDSEVDSVLKLVENAEDKETEKEKEILDSSIKEREFRIEYSSSFVTPLKDKKFIAGKWKTPSYGEINLQIENSNLKGIGRVSDTSLPPSFGQPNQSRNLTLEGKITGNTAKYSITIDSPTLLGMKKYSGLMLFYPERLVIKALELDEDKKTKIFNFTKVF